MSFTVSEESPELLPCGSTGYYLHPFTTASNIVDAIQAYCFVIPKQVLPKSGSGQI